MQPPLSRVGTVQGALAPSHQAIIDRWTQRRSVAASVDLSKQGNPVYKVCDSAYQSGKLAMRLKEIPPELWGSIVSRHRWKDEGVFQKVRRRLQRCCVQTEAPSQDKAQEKLEKSLKGSQSVGSPILCSDHPGSAILAVLFWSVWRIRSRWVTCTPSLQWWWQHPADVFNVFSF